MGRRIVKFVVIRDVFRTPILARASGRGRSESPDRTTAAEARRVRESLGREARSRRAVETALAKRQEEVQHLKSEIASLKVRVPRPIPRRRLA